MRLIDFQGLNCYQNSLITIAASMGVDYTRAFINLWPETDFAYDNIHKVYTSKRLLENLAVLGIKIDASHFASITEAQEALSIIDCGEPFLIGMDTFHIPWSPAAGVLHDTHYFAARKEPSGLLSCFDPTYNVQRTISGDIAPHLSMICRINRVAEKPLIMEECSAEIRRCHPQMQRRLLGDLELCIAQREHARLLAQYVSAMISNRYLYKYYLDNTPLCPALSQHFFNEDFFSRWAAVKNGLYKACVAKHNEGIIHEVSDLFRRITDDELLSAAHPRG